MKRTILLAALLFPALAAVDPTHAKEIKIGLITPLSGDVKTYGESVRNSFLIAVEEANAKGGVAGMKITYVIQDDRNDATEAANVANLLVNQYRVKAVIAVGAVFLGSLLAGGFAAAFLAFLVGLPTLRLTSDYLGIATLGFGVIMKVLFDNADSLVPQLGGARGMTGIARLTGIPWAVAALVAAILVIRNLVHSTYGRALVAIREDEVAAAAMGIDTFRFKLIGFTAGCAFAGVAGGLYAHLYTFLHPSSFDFLKSFDVLMIVVLGGLGNMMGTLVASFAWIFLLEGMRVALPPEYIEFRWVLIPLLLIVTMLVRPRGVLP